MTYKKLKTLKVLAKFVPAATVIRMEQALFIVTGCKEYYGGLNLL